MAANVFGDTVSSPGPSSAWVMGPKPCSPTSSWLSVRVVTATNSSTWSGARVLRSPDWTKALDVLVRVHHAALAAIADEPPKHSPTSASNADWLEAADG